MLKSSSPVWSASSSINPLVQKIMKGVYSTTPERRGIPVVTTLAYHAARRVQFPGWEARIIRCKILPIYVRDCESLCISDETLKAVGPLYLVSMPGEVKYPTQGVNV